MPARSGPAHPIHLVLGDSGAGCVRAACVSHGMPGSVVGFSADLTQGLLLAHSVTSNVTESNETDRKWSELIVRLGLERPDALVIWTSDNVADAVFVAMACARLARRPEPLLRVEVPAVDMRPFVAMHSPEQLARLYDGLRPMALQERTKLARDFTDICETSGPLRRLVLGRVVGVPLEYYDHLLLAACSEVWQSAGRVVGAAMGHCDGPNLMSDTFFLARLDCLIDDARIEIEGPRTASLRDSRVRLNMAPCVFAS